MKIIVARHAETNYNQQKLINYDPAVTVFLTENGVRQATELAEALKDEPIDLIVVSELNRTRETAEIVNKYHGAPTIADARLNDIKNGLEGESTEKYHQMRDSAPDPLHAHFNGGESIADVGERTKDFLAELKKRSEQTVLVVTSNHNAKHFRMLAEGLTLADVLKLHVPNASFFAFELEAGR